MECCRTLDRAWTFLAESAAHAQKLLEKADATEGGDLLRSAVGSLVWEKGREREREREREQANPACARGC